MISRKIIIFSIIIVLALFAITSLVRNISKATLTDFHSYWYSGHFVLQFRDPYEAFLQRQELSFPIHYVDGITISSHPVYQPGLATVPANTAPIILLMTSFSLFSWPTAKTLWLIINTLLVLSLPWIALRLYPNAATNSLNWQTLLIILSFWSYVGVRNLITTGQTSGLIFALMLLTVFTIDRNWILSGISLGLALSKYSLSLPVLLFLIFKKEYKIVLLSFLVQITGLLLLSFAVNVSPIQILLAYIHMARFHANMPGINLTAALQLDSLTYSSILFILAFTAAVIIPILLWRHRYFSRLPVHYQQLGELHILSILIAWSLLVVYHREYDIIIIIIPIILLLYGLKENIWNLPKATRTIIFITVILITAWFMRPQLTLFTILPSHAIQSFDQMLVVEIMWRLTAIPVFLCLILMIVLLYRIHPISTTQSS